MSRSSMLDRLEEIYSQGKYTAKDYFKLPEGSPYQLIEGELIMAPSLLTEHQIISKNLELLIFTHVKKYNLGLALNAPIDVYLDNKNAYQPDIIFISNKNKDIIKKRGIDGPPDLVIEILSPSNEYYDIKIKKEVYERRGVIEYIIIDTETKSVEIFRRTGSGNLKTKAASGKFDEILSVKAENSDGLHIKTLDLTIDLKDIFTEI